MVEWEGDYEDTLQPMTDLIGSACKYFGRVQLISMKVMYLKLLCLVEDAELLKKEALFVLRE